MVEIKEGQGLEFMYALLGAHANFAASDQQLHTTILMDMHKLFADGHRGQPNPITAIENAQLQLRQAGEVGVVPYASYDMCGRDTIQAVGLISTEISAVTFGFGVQNLPGLRGCHGQAFDRRYSSTPGASGPTTDLGN